MNEKIRSQILDIRNSGAVNMFSVNEVQRLAFEKDYHELVIFQPADIVNGPETAAKNRRDTLNHGIRLFPAFPVPDLRIPVHIGEKHSQVILVRVMEQDIKPAVIIQSGQRIMHCSICELRTPELLLVCFLLFLFRVRLTGDRIAHVFLERISRQGP